MREENTLAVLSSNGRERWRGMAWLVKYQPAFNANPMEACAYPKPSTQFCHSNCKVSSQPLLVTTASFRGRASVIIKAVVEGDVPNFPRPLLQTLSDPVTVTSSARWSCQGHHWSMISESRQPTTITSPAFIRRHLDRRKQ
ncbi:hypothetical protein NL676_019902 [Syzygium grande]|nr:hypothetical protein NL676_019902 [Syzygium grande]